MYPPPPRRHVPLQGQVSNSKSDTCVNMCNVFFHTSTATPRRLTYGLVTGEVHFLLLQRPTIFRIHIRM